MLFFLFVSFFSFFFCLKSIQGPVCEVTWTYTGIDSIDVGISAEGKVFSIEQIYENIWNEEAIGADNTVAVHIRHIREKIEINPREPRYLKVVWGIGYKIEKM